MFDGFIRCIRADFGVDKVICLNSGHFVVRFTSEQARDTIIDNRIWFFVKTPLTLRPWFGEVDVLVRVKAVQVWVKFSQLLVRYWSEKSLSAISSLLGKPVMTNKITKDRTWLNFARVLTEVELSTDVVEVVNFVNEYGQLVDQKVEYEWLLAKCCSCNGFGHLEKKCRKKER